MQVIYRSAYRLNFCTISILCVSELGNQNMGQSLQLGLKTVSLAKKTRGKVSFVGVEKRGAISTCANAPEAMAAQWP